MFGMDVVLLGKAGLYNELYMYGWCVFVYEMMLVGFNLSQLQGLTRR